MVGAFLLSQGELFFSFFLGLSKGERVVVIQVRFSLRSANMDLEFLERIQRMKLTIDEDEAMTVRPVRRQEILKEYSLSLTG